MAITINPKQKIVIVIDSKEYALTKPTLGMQEDFEERLHETKESGKGATKLLIGFLVECGLPVEVVKKLDADEMDAVMKAIQPLKKS
jgi:hypothetical protein